MWLTVTCTDREFSQGAERLCLSCEIYISLAVRNHSVLSQVEPPNGISMWRAGSIRCWDYPGSEGPLHLQLPAAHLACRSVGKRSSYEGTSVLCCSWLGDQRCLLDMIIFVFGRVLSRFWELLWQLKILEDRILACKDALFNFRVLLWLWMHSWKATNPKMF